MVTSASSTLLSTIGLVAVCGFLLCSFEGVKHELLPDFGTLTSHTAAIFFVSVIVAVICVSPIALSIAVKKRSDDVLRQSEEQYRLVFETNPIAMYVHARRTLRILAVNKAAIEQYGYTEQEFLAKTILEIRPEEDIPHLLQDVAAHTGGLQKRGHLEASQEGRYKPGC